MWHIAISDRVILLNTICCYRFWEHSWRTRSFVCSLLIPTVTSGVKPHEISLTLLSTTILSLKNSGFTCPKDRKNQNKFTTILNDVLYFLKIQEKKSRCDFSFHRTTFTLRKKSEIDFSILFFGLSQLHFRIIHFYETCAILLLDQFNH